MKKDLSLPQNEQCQKHRLRQLTKTRKKYAYSLTYRGQIATIDKLPSQEKQDLYYYFKMFTNFAGTFTSLPGTTWNILKHKFSGRPFSQYSDYSFFYKAPIPNKAMWDNFEDNQYLGYQRVAGMNAGVIEGINPDNPLPETFKITASDLAMEQHEFAAKLSQGRFYVTNYAMLKPLLENAGTQDGLNKYVSPLIALYYQQDDGSLEIKAVQMDVTESTSEANPIITPDAPRWSITRAFIQAADATHHELWTHATRAHYVMESVIMVTHRQLAQNHPLFAFLSPHLTHTLAVNINPLFQPEPDGTIPTFGQMFGCNNASLVDFMGVGMNEYSFDSFAFPNDIKRRNVESADLCYPYRDDGLLWWEECQRFALEYLQLYYHCDADVCEDNELQQWAYELGGSKAQDHCGLTDFPTSFNKVEDVAKIAGQILFICTAHHASVHYPQYECAGYVPNMPFAAYTAPQTAPTSKPDEATMMSYFPRLKMAFYQSFIFYLTNFKVNRVGDYPMFGYSSSYKAVIETHQRKIEAIATQIEQRNSSRRYKYNYMHPKNVPNSITV